MNLSKRLLNLFFCLSIVAVTSACNFGKAQLECTPNPSEASSPEEGFSLVINGFDQVVGIENANDGSDRLFFIDKIGCLYVLDDGNLETFLNVRDRVATNGGEKGLLGLAFHPDYKVNGRFFINYVDLKSDDTIVAEYAVSDNPNQARPEPVKTILRFDQPFGNHNGGHLAFSPKDGYLYIATGDGGDGGDPREYAENLTSYLGKILRLDIDNGDPYAIPEDNPYTVESGALPEIWAYGLRNPWRYSFDRETADLYIGDVGQRLFEEINFQAADSTGKENYGWNQLEGSSCFNKSKSNQPLESCEKEGTILPILEYDHSQGVSVTGGFVYRGTENPEWQGKYFYADFAMGTIWIAERNEDGSWSSKIFSRSPFRISSFGEDESGELYLADFGGKAVYKLGSNN